MSKKQQTCSGLRLLSQPCYAVILAIVVDAVRRPDLYMRKQKQEDVHICWNHVARF